MSTILRGFTFLDAIPEINIEGLDIEYRTRKDGKLAFIIDITDRNFTDFEAQVGDTIAFLKTNELRLLELKNQIPKLSWDIDFGYNTKVATGELAIEGLHFPFTLLALCARLEIELLVSLYSANQFE
ncbi:MAG: hypothetical protein ACXVLT_11135 [Flavisolibacter sp.]